MLQQDFVQSTGYSTIINNLGIVDVVGEIQNMRISQKAQVTVLWSTMFQQWTRMNAKSRISQRVQVTVPQLAISKKGEGAPTVWIVLLQVLEVLVRTWEGYSIAC